MAAECALCVCAEISFQSSRGAYLRVKYWMYRKLLTFLPADVKRYNNSISSSIHQQLIRSRQTIITTDQYTQAIAPRYSQTSSFIQTVSAACHSATLNAYLLSPSVKQRVMLWKYKNWNKKCSVREYKTCNDKQCLWTSNMVCLSLTR